MSAAPDIDGLRRDGKTRAAGDRPLCAGHPVFGDRAGELFDLGYEPLPIIPGLKRPAPTRWSQVAIVAEQVRCWAERYPDHGIGLRTGRLVGLDIDILDPDVAHAIDELAGRRLGSTLIRVGLWPKRLLLYRTDEQFCKCTAGKVEWLGQGQQFVAFGRHPDTGRTYYWPEGETPFDVPLDDLPAVDEASAHAFLAEAQALQPNATEVRRARPGERAQAARAPVRGEDGTVLDGRDGWMSAIAYHVIQDAIEAGEPLEAAALVPRVWSRFAETADLVRPRKDGGAGYSLSDAARKVRDKLRLHRENRLPAREVEEVTPAHQGSLLPLGEARRRLDDVLGNWCERVFLWHEAREPALPKLGIRATVGLGKSRASRTLLLRLADRLRTSGLPHRLLVFTATHALADEAEIAWRQDGAAVVVLRGYDRADPRTSEPLCREREAVAAAHAVGVSAQSTVCTSRTAPPCRFFETCLKQANRRDVAAADVVIAPYDALFSGFAFETDDIALLLVDEACWPRAVEHTSEITAEDFRDEPVADIAPGSLGKGPVGSMADLLAFRRQAGVALATSGAGPVKRAALLGAGLTAETCRAAASLERWRRQEPRLAPNLTGGARAQALAIAAKNIRIDAFAAIWQAFAELLEGSEAASGQLTLRPPDPAGRHRLYHRRVRGLHESLRSRPVLYLDATLRPDLACRILGPIEIEEIEAEAPHMQVRLVSGSFGKSMICPDASLAPAEHRRRQNRLAECVEYVRWHALRHAPGRVLVVTYKGIEAAFAGIDGVETAHFNAIAGLDDYRDVSLLITIGRPLPSHSELEALTGAYLGSVQKPGYATKRAGLTMRDGSQRVVRCIRHRDDAAEVLRAAISDDELVQAIGRGRGVNRTADNPLEVHVLADVALPIVHDRVTTWEVEVPDVFQRMLLAEVAVDSPADAAALHPDLLSDEKQAQKLFERSGFKRQNPNRDTYREMSLKSAAYRRPGRGCGWQWVWWVGGDASDVRQVLEHALGPLAGFKGNDT